MAINIILASHGLFAQEALKSAEMIIGLPQKNVAVLSVTKGKTYEESLEEIQTKLKALNEKNTETLILVDIFGGTPANVSTYLTLTNENVLVYSGLNMPVLLELCLSNPENLAEAKNIIERTYPQALVNITEKAKEGEKQNANQVDSY
ncbi:PTS system fructose subfamily transporter subunit IIA [uncultured Lactobacillus sp.]|uniref:PTS sugar transporter subunit IIA n=1 Tax=uncultured Lactobacillus sp. TaxID=153152 RepID=UPI0025F45BB2|nr:PTS system fructose subfamily transporter subunit IIA [uncultured Lactobacillus sp.]